MKKTSKVENLPFYIFMWLLVVWFIGHWTLTAYLGFTGGSFEDHPQLLKLDLGFAMVICLGLAATSFANDKTPVYLKKDR